MPLQLPNLDDRGYKDLVTEALARIPTLAPKQWTNYNPSDPGITLIELFAYLTDMLLYRANRVTDNNRRKFLKLLNGPDWSEPPQNADLRDEIRKAVLGIRERYRAVTSEDYEFLSSEAFNNSEAPSPMPRVARAHCVPQRNLGAGTEAGRQKPVPGHVSVLIIPEDSATSTPQPSADQIDALLCYLDKRRLVTTRLHVTGPFYVHVAPKLVIARKSEAVEVDLRGHIADKLSELLDPLAWPFGRDVFVSAVYKALKDVSGIDFVSDVMLESRPCQGDNNCVEADPIWHEEGDFIGLSIEEHHLPIYRGSDEDIVIAVNSNFITLNIDVSAKVNADADLRSLKRQIKSTVKNSFYPSKKTTGPTDISLAEVKVLVRDIPGVKEAEVAVKNCSPASALQNDKVHVGKGEVIDCRVFLQLN